MPTTRAQYLTAARDPDELLRSAAEAVLREEIAGRPFAELLTVGRSAVERAALDRLRARVAGLGVELEAVALHDLHPPAEVVESYHDVARAAEARDKLVNDAHAAATRTVREAEAKSLRAVRDAEAAAADHVSQARLRATRSRHGVTHGRRSTLARKRGWPPTYSAGCSPASRRARRMRST